MSKRVPKQSPKIISNKNRWRIIRLADFGGLSSSIRMKPVWNPELINQKLVKNLNRHRLDEFSRRLFCQRNEWNERDREIDSCWEHPWSVYWIPGSKDPNAISAAITTMIHNGLKFHPKRDCDLDKSWSLFEKNFHCWTLCFVIELLDTFRMHLGKTTIVPFGNQTWQWKIYCS